jgi:hypothetical protein
MLATLRDGNGFPGLEFEENDGPAYELNKETTHVWVVPPAENNINLPGAKFKSAVIAHVVVLSTGNDDESDESD